MNQSNVLFILGNGPSLEQIFNNSNYLKILKQQDTFGLNAAYREFPKYDFQPTYYGCFDFVLNESHKHKFEQLILGKNQIKEFYFIGSRSQKQNCFSSKVKKHPKFKNFTFIPNNPEKVIQLSTNLNHLYDMGISAANAVQIGILKGYKTIILLGCDANYTEQIPEAHWFNEKTKTLIMKKNPVNNPNYWFKEYQLSGDKFNLPQVAKFHLPAWKNISKLCPSEVKIINGSLQSKIPFFDKNDDWINEFREPEINYQIIRNTCREE